MRKIWVLLLVFFLIQLISAEYDQMQELLDEGNYLQLLAMSQDGVYAEETARNYYYLGAAYAGLNRPTIADIAFQKVMTYPDYTLSMGHYIAAFYESNNETSQAADTYEKLINKFPNETKDISLKLGELYYNQKRYSDTVSIFSDFIYKDETKANPLAYFVGLSYSQLHNNRKAEEYLELALKNGFENPDLYIRLGQLKILRGEFKKGAEQMAKGLSETTEAQTPETYVTLGQAYAKQNQYTQASAAYRKAIETGANEVEVFLEYADNSTRNKNFQGIVDTLEPRVFDFSKNGEYLYYLANSYDNLGIPIQAIAYYQKTLDAGYANKDYIKGRMTELSSEQQ